MATHTFIVNGQRVSVDCEDSVRLLWVLRDLLGIHGPKYGCGLDVCKACTCHINGKAFNPCSVPVSDIKPDDRITTIEGLPETVGKALHPMQEAWLELRRRPVRLLPARADHGRGGAGQGEGGNITEADLDGIRNICRCGTYPRIREAISSAAADVVHGKMSARRVGPRGLAAGARLVAHVRADLARGRARGHARGARAGINFLDDARYNDETGTAPIPTGYSEVLFGELFRAAGWHRADTVVTNKLWWEFWPEQSAAAELDGSLGRMKFDYVDLIYANPPPEGLAVPDMVAAGGRPARVGQGARLGHRQLGGRAVLRGDRRRGRPGRSAAVRRAAPLQPGPPRLGRERRR